MKKSLLAILLISFSFINAQTPCTGGTAGPYSCDGYDLQSAISLAQMNANAGNDSWGWTDPSNGDEYALVGLNNGTAFIDITNPTTPIYLGKLPTHTSSSTWRDIKVYNNHAFVVSEANNHGMQVFDLTRLRSVTSPPVTFSEDAHYNGFGSAHNLVINEDTGYAYGVGTGSYNGGPHFVNIQDPINPIAAGGYEVDGYSHDAQIVTYCGPDKDYSGREILIGSNEDEVIIADITDKANPVDIATISYSNVGYSHQGWFTEDERYFILGDETDELGSGFNTRTIVFDFEDLDNPQFHFEHFGTTPAIDHNGYTRGTKYYMASYRAGLRVFDLTNIAGGSISEEGYFDSYPGSNSANFSGAWSVYPYFDSGNIVISDINRGFLLVKASTIDLTAPTANCQNITIVLDASGNATITAPDVDNGSSDNSGTVYLEICNDTFTCDDLGPNDVTLEIYDDFGNKDYCTSVVTVIDALAPILECPADLTVEYDTGSVFYTVTDFGVTAADNCTASPTITQDPAVGTELTAGVYTVTIEATDAEGNMSDCSFQLTVEGILSIQDVTLEAGLALYPNPTSDILYIASENQRINSIVVYDILGKKYLSNNQINSENTSIDLSRLSRGVYFIKINNLVIKRIIRK
ncbi:MAG: choice-of-anchor B domain-containing protein [Candidatus Latescibacterota bacterium]|jgi:choice-of-anchor B domain-containing protein